MTLTETANMIMPNGDDFLTVCVFDCDGAREAYRQEGDKSYFLFAVKSPYKLHVVLNEKYANAKVESIYVVDATTVDIVIDLEE